MNDILIMHKMITDGSDERDNVPGELRSHSVQAGSTDLGGIHVGAPHERLGELMEEFISFLGSCKVSIR